MNRSFKQGALLLACLFITGCYEKGVFVGPVAGLNYATLTTSGITSATGEFKYKKGETVTFSIGGIELGSAPGAATISPFDLFGMTPPADELALRLELNTRKDITNFDRAANVAFLLYSLDNDANPDNGLDVTGWDSALATAELDFNANLYRFARKFRRFAGANGINPNVVPTQPMTQLYKSLGLVVPVHLVDTVVVDLGNDGTNEYVFETGYDARGLMTAWSFDDGVFSIRDTFAHTAQGRTTAFYRAYDHDGDDIPNAVEGELSTYDSNGDLATLTYEGDYDGNGVPDYRDATSHVYDVLGSLVSSRSEADADLNGTIVFTTDYTYTHDADGNLLTKVRYQDSDLDGNADHRESNVYTYDAAGNILTWQLSSGSNDGSVDFIETETFTYDAAGNRLTHRQESDFNADGVADSSQYRTWTYDELGNALSLVVERVDGFNPGRTYVTYSYNSDRTLLMSDLILQDLDSDGEFDDSSTKASYTYDEFGNVLERFEELDFDMDGTIDSTNLSRSSLMTHSDGMFSLLFYYSDLPRFPNVEP